MYFLLGIHAKTNGTLRLLGESSYRSGIVEVYILSGNSSRWDTVCSHSGWDNRDAIVACKQLGFGDNATATSDRNLSAINNTAEFLKDLECNGDESRLIYCNHKIENNHCNESAGLTCGGSLPSKQ